MTPDTLIAFSRSVAIKANLIAKFFYNGADPEPPLLIIKNSVEFFTPFLSSFCLPKGKQKTIKKGNKTISRMVHLH